MASKSIGLAAGLSLCAVVGCGDAEVASIFIKSVEVRASAGAVIEVSAQDNAELAGTRLEIPPGALASDTRITLLLGREPLVELPALPAGPVAVFGPGGTFFQGGAELRLPMVLSDTQAPGNVILAQIEDDGVRHSHKQPAFTLAGSVATVTIDQVSTFGLATLDCSQHPDVWPCIVVP